MNIADFTTPITSKTLNESAFRQFGQSLDVENMTLEELYDARNKLRTMLHQFENASHFSEINESEKYQKARIFVDVLNKAINERSEYLNLSESERKTLDMVSEGKMDRLFIPKTLMEKAKSKSQQAFMGMVVAAQNGKKPASKKVVDAAKSMSKKAASEYASTSTKKLPSKVRPKSKKLVEGEEEKASLIMQSRDMVNRITGWMENCASMQAEQMLDLTDSIRYELGAETAAKFEQIVKPALNEIYAVLESNRKKLTVGISILTGEEHAMMGEVPQPNQEQGTNLGTNEVQPQPDNFGASSAASGQGNMGRETRESREYRRKK